MTYLFNNRFINLLLTPAEFAVALDAALDQWKQKEVEYVNWSGCPTTKEKYLEEHAQMAAGILPAEDPRRTHTYQDEFGRASTREHAEQSFKLYVEKLQKRKQQLSQRPHCLYRIFGKDNSLLHIGITYDPTARWPDHEKKPWWREVESIKLEKFSDRKSALNAESAAIAAEKPRYNVQYNS